MLSRAGLKVLDRDGRTLISRTSDPMVSAVFIRASDIPRIVEAGAADLGITGHDFVAESGAKVKEALDLGFGKAKIAIMASANSEIKSVEDITSETRVATKYVNIAREFFGKLGKEPRIIGISGASEVMPYLGVADVVIDTVSTGTTLRLHNLKVVDTIMETSARLIVNENGPRSNKIDDVILALKSVILAERKAWIVMNVPDKHLKDVISILPAMAGPTIAKVEASEPMWEVNSVVREDEVYKVILDAKKRGARDILVLNIDRLVP